MTPPMPLMAMNKKRVITAIFAGFIIGS